ncbi:Spc98 family-domain-containing protein [Aspergillus karnatakaensis]|uniref:tubulin gamma complex associated family protein n=1 Tax=Aspergillus karnatakaensis TaxID=1810916 RepID=UPI003CCE3340
MIMDSEDYGSNPFSSYELWRISKFTLDSLQPLEALPWDKNLPDLSEGVFKCPSDLFDQDTARLHDLDIFGANLFEPSLSAESTTDASSEGQLETSTFIQDSGDELEDIWNIDVFDLPPRVNNAPNSWEKYKDRQFCERVSAYFSDSGAKGFDAALGDQLEHDDNSRPNRVVRNDIFFQSLFRLGLGWGSMLFQYNERQQKFENAVKGIRISGVSALALGGLTDEVLQCGTNMQRVRAFINRMPTKTAEPSALSAFSTTASVVVYTLEKQLLSCSKQTSSVLQIRSLFQRCGELVGALAEMVDTVERAGSEAQIISSIFKRAAHYSHIYGQMENLFREIVFKVVGPWLSYVESWIGFRPETSTSLELLADGRSFVLFERHTTKGKFQPQERLEYVYLPEQMPAFIPPDQAHLMFESGRSLRLLKKSHPQHPLASERRRVANSPRLGCAGTWAELARIQTKARDYESSLRAEILKYNRDGASEHESHTNISAESESRELPGTFDLFDIDDTHNVTGLLANDVTMKKEKLGQLLDETKYPAGQQANGLETNFAPEVTSSLYLSLAPLLSSQALLIDFSCLHLLFKEHKLRDHLSLQWRFQLLGDGYFTSRLSHSLFDPEMESGERKTGVVRSGVHTGLRLGSRDSWPPASSELRLVLMGILNECYGVEYADGSGNPEFQKERELPGGLSFSIRELTGEEIAKCKNPNAIEALDFLRLQYKPSNVLEAIITQHSLTKYDHLFKQLLRLLRMVSVVKGLIRDSTARNSLSGDTRNILQKFRIDCQHFVLSLSDYCFQLGIGSTWQRFQDTLSKIESCLDRGDIDGTIEAAHSIPRLRAYHEDTLDQMIYALFLSKRHTEVAKLIDGIFDTILRFAPLSRMDGMHGVRHESEVMIKRLYAVFRKQTSAFVGYLRSLDGARAAAPSKALGRRKSGMAFAVREGPSNVFDHLLVRLDMKRYY